MMLGSRARVLIVDDNVSVRTALYRLLAQEPDLVPIGMASSGDDACVSAAMRSPDIVLMDVQMPGMDGVEATRWITRHIPCARVVGMSAEDATVAGACMRAAGAVDFVSKIDGMRRVVEAVHSVAADCVAESNG